MHKTALSRPEKLTKPVNLAVMFSVADVRILAIDPGLFAPCSDYARSFYPRSTLARVAA